MIIQLRLNNPYVSELDRLLQERRKQYPAQVDTSLKRAPLLLRKRSFESLPFSLKRTPPGSSR